MGGVEVALAEDRRMDELGIVDKGALFMLLKKGWFAQDVRDIVGFRN